MTELTVDPARLNHLRRCIRPEMEGYVYVVEFSSGTVKVGMTKDWKKRLYQHAREAQNHGLAITQSWSSVAHVGQIDNERELVSFCLLRYGQPVSGEEYFAGADFAAVVQFAQALPYVLLRQEDLDARALDYIAGEQDSKRRVAARYGSDEDATHVPAAEAPDGSQFRSLLASLTDEQAASFRHRMDREEWAQRVRLRREIRAWELSGQGRAYAAQYGFTTRERVSS